jgi:hypothetical protein
MVPFLPPIFPGRSTIISFVEVKFQCDIEVLSRLLSKIWFVHQPVKPANGLAIEAEHCEA